MNKDNLNQSLKVEQLEDRFEMTMGALDAARCTITTGDISLEMDGPSTEMSEFSEGGL